MNIAVPSGDAYFDPDGTGTQEIPFSRSRYDLATGTDVDNPRQQINEITAWIDASVVYGSDQATADSLRTFVGGKLRTGDGNLLPTGADGFFEAGDVRANENVELSSMQALFMREHNWWADQDCQPESQLGRRADLPASSGHRRRRDAGDHIQRVLAGAVGSGCLGRVSRLRSDRQSGHRQRVFHGRLSPRPQHDQQRRGILRQRRSGRV